MNFLSPEANVHDPLKTIHVYGVGICCCASSNVCGLARYLDMKARGRAVNVHMISEVFYGGGWHMIDGSLMNYFFLPDGTLASADEIHKAVVQWHERNPGYRGDWGKLAQFAAKGNWRKAGPPLVGHLPHVSGERTSIRPAYTAGTPRWASTTSRTPRNTSTGPRWATN